MSGGGKQERKNNESEDQDDIIPLTFEYTGEESVPLDVVSVRFHPSVIEVEENAFRGRVKLEEVVLNEGLKAIGVYSFCYCTSLQSITLPSTLTNIGRGAFKECSKLNKVVINEGLHEIGEAAFFRCLSLNYIKFSSTVTTIGKGAFARCNKLREVVFNKGLQKIDERAFFLCSSLLSISLPSTVTEIEEHAFQQCRNLRYISLNEGLQSIGKNAFFYCESLESISLPSTIVEIGGDLFVEGATYFNNTFGSCGSLTEVGINTNTEMIYRRAFSGCDSLERFTFPSVSNRLERIIHCSKDIKKKVNEVRGAIQRKGGMLFASADSMGIGRMFPVSNQNGMNWAIIRESLLKIDRWTKYYEIREATTLLELALWKANMNLQEEDTPTANRDAYCIEVPGPVKETILKYLCPADQYMVWRGEAWLFPESDYDSDYSFSSMEDDSMGDDSDIDQEMNFLLSPQSNFNL